MEDFATGNYACLHVEIFFINCILGLSFKVNLKNIVHFNLYI